jgi:hypothetical protein
VQEELAQLRSRVAEGEEWQRKREAEVELLRNALQRRDALLVSQRTSFYRELLSHQDYANIASVGSMRVGSMQPSVTLDEMHRLERFATAGQKAAERPAFFDACIFEAAHLELDEPLARKVTAALQAAAGREARLQAELNALHAAGTRPAAPASASTPGPAPALAALAAAAPGRTLAAETALKHRRLGFGQTDEALGQDGGRGGRPSGLFGSSDAEGRVEALQAQVRLVLLNTCRGAPTGGASLQEGIISPPGRRWASCTRRSSRSSCA